MYECKECGYKIESEQQGVICPVCNKPMEKTSEGEKPENKKSNKWKSALITILVVVIARFGGSYIAEKMMNNSVEKDMEKFIEKVEAYTPGKVTEDGYESEYLGLRMNIDSNWEEVDATELTDIEKGGRASAEESMMKTLKEENVSDELAEKYKETLFCEVEAGYYYVPNNTVDGVVYAMTYSAYVPEDTSVKEMETGLLDEFGTILENTSRGTSSLGNKEYRYIDGIYSEGGSEIKMRVYVKYDGVVVSMFEVLYAEECEEMTEAFEKAISKY